MAIVSKSRRVQTYSQPALAAPSMVFAAGITEGVFVVVVVVVGAKPAMAGTNGGPAIAEPAPVSASLHLLPKPLPVIVLLPIAIYNPIRDRGIDEFLSSISPPSPPDSRHHSGSSST